MPAAHPIDLDLRRRHRHHNDAVDSELCAGHGDALCVVASRAGHDASSTLLGCQRRDLIVRPAELEREDLPPLLSQIYELKVAGIHLDGWLGYFVTGWVSSRFR